MLNLEDTQDINGIMNLLNGIWVDIERKKNEMDYKLFKLLQEMAYVNTFKKDKKIKKKYKKYLRKEKENDNRRKIRKSITLLI
jgi:hypothetical protein